ncbi:hypothetical protein T4A_13663 [Trichinella pseudospiralis]|uniref:Uncharacterized protein n=1 Tax=Trichinella pseudospiralis TaxID=6337 RepID=A0A0V1E801_TRIPS|nr:hypothetical protein T4A_13663 [Trichinella pseudospiralis]
MVEIIIPCNEPLPRAGSSVSSARLLARPSLFGDEPVLAAAFPFLSASRFNDGIATTKQQTMSKDRRRHHNDRSFLFNPTHFSASTPYSA